MPDLATRLFMLAAQLGEAADRHRAERADKQETLISSIDPKSFSSLADFVYTSAKKYKLGGAGKQLPQIYTIHAVLLRRFVFDNPSLQTAPVEEETPDSDAEYDEAEAVHPKKKAKMLPAKRGKLAKAENFWGRVDLWLKDEVAECGASLLGPKWRSYVDQLMRDDNVILAPDYGPIIAYVLQSPLVVYLFVVATRARLWLAPRIHRGLVDFA
ncbi:hypothetical protein C8R47DRAFT_1082857 [Mycena vitilis]|nr:hypothetical protein C8R47DRAFT_1082857 [Mycena vitilis]